MRFFSRIFALAITPCFVSMGFVGVGCGSSLDEPEGTPGQSIGASGGYVSSADGVFTVVFPPGALLETTLVTVTPAADAPASVGVPYTINGPSALADDIFLQYRYTLPQIQGRAPENLRLAGSAGDRWDTLPDPIVDLDLQTVRASSSALNPAFGLVEGLDMGTGTDTMETDDGSSTMGEDSSGTDDPSDAMTDDTGSSDTGEDVDTDDPTVDPSCGDGVPDDGELCWALGDPLLGKGMGPVALAVGDLDGMDGDDIVVALQGSTSVAVWLSDGAGSTAPELLLPVAAAPLDVTLGDFDDDGTVDIAAISASAVAVLPGDGAGGFGEEVTITLGGGSLAAAPADVDEDDTPDLVVLRANQAGVLLGQGMTLGEEATFTAGAGRVAMALGDATLDQNVDIITVGNGGVTVLSGNGSGLFGKPLASDVGGTLVALAAGQFNGDDAIDVAVLDEAGARIVVLLGNGLGGFGGAIPYAVADEAAALQAADVDNDGTTDLVVVASSDDSVTVLHGQGNGSFDAGSPTVVGTRPSDLALGDLNADGQLDAVVIQEDGSIGLLLSAP